MDSFSMAEPTADGAQDGPPPMTAPVPFMADEPESVDSVGAMYSALAQAAQDNGLYNRAVMDAQAASVPNAYGR